MNDALKTLSRLLHPFGYKVAPHSGLNFLKIPALETPNNDGNIVAVRKSLGTERIPGRTDALTVFLRTCLRNERNIRIKTIPGGLPLIDTALRCVHSLARSVNLAASALPEMDIRVVVLDDRSDSDALEKLRVVLSVLAVPYDIRTTDTAGQGESLIQTFREARGQDRLCYIVEDDYLHERDGILRLCEFYSLMTEKTGSHSVLYPQEHHSIYNHHYPSYIVLGPDRHWRTIRHATHTLLTHGHVIKKYWRYFENTRFVGDRKKRRLGSEARTTNLLFRHIPGYSPLRPCAVHFQALGLLPPFFDWTALWEELESASGDAHSPALEMLS